MSLIPAIGRQRRRISVDLRPALFVYCLYVPEWPNYIRRLYKKEKSFDHLAGFWCMGVGFLGTRTSFSSCGLGVHPLSKSQMEKLPSKQPRPDMLIAMSVLNTAAAAALTRQATLLPGQPDLCLHLASF